VAYVGYHGQTNKQNIITWAKQINLLLVAMTVWHWVKMAAQETVVRRFTLWMKTMKTIYRYCTIMLPFIVVGAVSRASEATAEPSRSSPHFRQTINRMTQQHVRAARACTQTQTHRYGRTDSWRVEEDWKAAVDERAMVWSHGHPSARSARLRSRSLPAFSAVVISLLC